MELAALAAIVTVVVIIVAGVVYAVTYLTICKRGIPHL